MTKDRARKHAARQRAALTGERYVVAQRATVAPDSPRTAWWHALTHRVPGVPAHADGGLQAGARRRRTGNPSGPVPQQHEPRVLVGWQNWIARRLGAAGR